MLLLAAIHFIVTIFTEGRIFGPEPFGFNLIIPLDGIAAKYYYFATKIVTLICLIVFYQGFYLIYRAYKEKRRKAIFDFILPLAICLAFYLINFIFCFPGKYNIDDTTMYALATRYFPFYWHHYLTSLFHMVGLTIFPFSGGQLVLLDVFTALIFAYVYYRLSQVLEDKKWNRLKYLLFIVALSPFISTITLESFRCYMYSILNLFFFAFLIFEKIQKRKLTLLKFILLALGVAVLALWRSESIVYLVFAPFFIYIAYAGSMNVKKVLAFTLSAVLLYFAINLPQQAGNKKYYNSDYLIVSTTRPLSVILNLDGTTDYEGGAADVEAINKVINVDFIKALPYDSISYQSWNSYINQGSLTQTMSTKENQTAYIKAFLNIINHNKGYFLMERLDLFIKTNHLDTVFKVDFGKELVKTMNTDQSLAPYWIQDSVIKESIITPKEMTESGRAYWGFITFQAEGANMIYIVIPWLIMAAIVIVLSIRKKAWLFFVIELSILAREGIIFLTSPSAMISYYMPTSTISLLLLLLLIAFGVYNKKAEKKLTLFI